MAIWSLTQERVDKILKQIGDKELEIDVLIQLSPKDLWNKDLDDFINEWHQQLDDEKKRAKKIAGISRRASAKLGISVKGGKKKKRRAGSDSDNSDSDADFAVTKKKPAVKAVMDRVKPKEKGASTLMSFFKQPEPLPPKATKAASAAAKPVVPGTSHTISDEVDDFMDIDDIPVETEVVAVKKRPAAAKPRPKAVPTVLSDGDDDEDVFAAIAQEAKSEQVNGPFPSRAARAKKPTRYVVSDDSDDSNGDDMLGDVSMMVKGIGDAASTRPLFSATAQRPTSSHGLQKAIPKAKSRSVDSDDEIDDTNYDALIPQDSPRRPAPRTANETFISGDEVEDEEDLPIIKPKGLGKAKAVAKVSSKPAPKAVSKKLTAPKAAPAPIVKKPTTLSPAGKAYARKQAAKDKEQSLSKLSSKKILSESEPEDEEENDLANQLLGDSDEEMDDVPVTRPGRRAAAAAATKAKYVVVSEDEDESEEASEESYDEDEESD